MVSINFNNDFPAIARYYQGPLIAYANPRYLLSIDIAAITAITS
jgi:hypothetical protein